MAEEQVQFRRHDVATNPKVYFTHQRYADGVVHWFSHLLLFVNIHFQKSTFDDNYGAFPYNMVRFHTTQTRWHIFVFLYLNLSRKLFKPFFFELWAPKKLHMACTILAVSLCTGCTNLLPNLCMTCTKLCHDGILRPLLAFQPCCSIRELLHRR